MASIRLLDGRELFAEDEMNIGIMGYGHAGKKHAKAYESIDEIKNIIKYDPYLDGWPSAIYQFFDHKIDIVSVCTPSHIRQEIIGRCALRDYDILVEKPLALTLDEAQQIIDTCHENNVMLAVVRRFVCFVLINLCLERRTVFL